MCGIAGIIHQHNKRMDLRQSMQDMLATIMHRGPDGEGIYQHQQLILGHRRLAILDLSTDGIQPMVSSCQNQVLVFNGEIYNYLEIKAELMQLGHVFLTKTDTEVILHAYQAWGPACVERFNGMWAFALFDKQKNQLFCSRDRFGVKPFYFINRDTHFMFCSEIKGLLPFVERKIANLDVLSDYLLTSKTDHQHHGFFKDIHVLPASHHLFYDLNTQEINIKRYYELKQLDSNPSADDYMACLDDAIALRLRSDVTVGTCLSGGLDSSTVASIAAKKYTKQTQQPFSAITAISEQASNNEADFAEMVVKHCQLNWLKTTPSYEHFQTQIEDIVYTQEEPFASPSIVMQYEVMKAARKANIPVLLDGQGGDETLLGYERYVATHALEEYRKHGIKGFIQGIKACSQHNTKLNTFKTAQYVIGTHFPGLRLKLHQYEHRYLVHQKFASLAHLKTYADAANTLFDLQKLEIEATNLPALLRFEDKNSMAHSIETRLPFLDYRAVEMALSLPFEVKIHQGWSKHLLRDKMQQQLPHEILWRKNKFGFEAPEQIWLSHHRDQMQDCIKQSRLIQAITKKTFNPSALKQRTLWRLYTIALWEKQFHIQDMQ
ncbi:MAG: asparagine synthase (glutamine-hydrolyzing) [Gammaproteobacteria bacterium]|nr:asparagine synthase (glutamine-hydrolyzing) [Gammaproteobacteria bacterium]